MPHFVRLPGPRFQGHLGKTCHHMERPQLEVPIFGPEAGVAAVRNGATRLELNRAGSYAVGGTTPTVDELRALLASLNQAGLPRPAIRIMIRPRGPPSPSPLYSSSNSQPHLHDFIYTPEELSSMAAAISVSLAVPLLNPAYGDGFVFGVLRYAAPAEQVTTVDDHIAKGQPPPPLALDIEANRHLVSLAGPYPCVLHRAVDDLLAQAPGAGIKEVLKDVLACGFDGVLTSGGPGSAAGNLEGLKGVLAAAASAEAAGVGGDGTKRREVEVVVGGGVRRGNVSTEAPTTMLLQTCAVAATYLAASLPVVAGQTFQRLGTCPDLGCIIPPDQQDFLPGQEFDIRFEIHAPQNGSEAAVPNAVPDANFTATITRTGGDGQGKAKGKGKGKGNQESVQSITTFFGLDSEPALETWTFSWYEDLFARDARTPSVVKVASRAYRRVALYEPGEYVVTLEYTYGGQKKTTTATWTVRQLATKKKTKNVIFFIGDGMTTNMITAARLLAHKTVNGRYQSLLALDGFPVLGHQMTHSIDTFITDSANSASALYTGHKSSVNALGVYADSSPDPLDDPKVETIVELLYRIWGSAWGAVSTAFIADATPAALTGHSRARGQYGVLVDQALNGVRNYSWTKTDGPDVYFGGGAEQFIPGSGSYQGKNYYNEFANKGYSVSWNRTALLSAPSDKKALGIFCRSNLPVWLDRHIFPENVESLNNDPSGARGPAKDLPGLKDMTLKAIDVLHERGGEKGFFLMSEAASIDKQMHAMDYDRALADLLEMDDTVRATIEKLRELGILDDTLIVVSADHGHGFDVFGSSDTKYAAAQADSRSKRNAIGVYERSGLSHYVLPPPEGTGYSTGPNFPLNWDPRYVLAAGVVAHPDVRESYGVDPKPRSPAQSRGGQYYARDAEGFLVNGTLPTDQAQGVHSLTDVPVYAMGPCQEEFGGTYSNIDVFFKMAGCLGLGHGKNQTRSG
ncbi:hypothetical protein VTJ49DRAFT_7043 [Mycothermus thermophilus]|uniref:alkaline phosphatase n=1 Tax=Humicola insolens TaxID=85995 RepID=A0ABR3VJ79_HUMIN